MSCQLAKEVVAACYAYLRAHARGGEQPYILGWTQADKDIVECYRHVMFEQGEPKLEGKVGRFVIEGKKVHVGLITHADLAEYVSFALFEQFTPGFNSE